jgi:starch-binding outer membrane protein, SusD/RagB family
LMAVFPSWGGFFTYLSQGNFQPMINQNTASHFEKIRIVTQITKIIGDLQASSLDASDKNELLGEAYCARGMLMYHLLTMYGPLPVITDPTKVGTDAESNLTRPAEADYAAIAESDLKIAGTNLPKVGAVYGRFNQGLALTELMRLYLYEKDYTDAEATGRQIAAMGYALQPNYMGLFEVATQHNNETIYAISVDPTSTGYDANGNMNAWSYYCLPSDFPSYTQKGGWAAPNGAYTATWAFFDSFDPNDARRQMLVPSYINLSGQQRDSTNMSGPVVRKYPDQSDQGTYQGNDIPLARFADVLLMLAEAINQNNGPTPEAVGFVNQVRERAGIADLSAGDIASKQAFADAILRERGWELFFEGFRRIDLIRFGKWPAAVAAIPQKTPGPALLPIPQYAIDESKGQLTQNPGY